MKISWIDICAIQINIIIIIIIIIIKLLLLLLLLLLIILKSEIYTPKRDNEHPAFFKWESPPFPGRKYTSFEREVE